MRVPGRFGPWVRGIAINLARMQLRAGRMVMVLGIDAAVSRLQESVYYGTLTVQSGDGATHEIGCRPSDAVNLAIRLAAPVFVAPDVMAQQGVSADGDHGDSFSFLPAEEGQVWRSSLNLVESTNLFAGLQETD